MAGLGWDTGLDLTGKDALIGALWQLYCLFLWLGPHALDAQRMLA